MEDHGGLLFSLWYGVYETTTRSLSFASAGHHPAYLLNKDGASPQPLATKAPAIGMMPSPRLAVETVRITPGSRLYLFSDGAFEITTAAGQAWTLADFVPLLRAPAQLGVSEPDRLFDAIRVARGPSPLDDDLSLIALAFP